MNKQQIIEFLISENVSFEITEHAPVFTVEEMKKANLPYPERVVKNLFIRDDKKKNYYLISVKEDRPVNLKDFQMQFATRRLSFASEVDLMEILRLTKGSVTPFGLLNDDEGRVQFFFGQELMDGMIGIHPNENTATVWMESKNLLTIIEKHKHFATIF